MLYAGIDLAGKSRLHKTCLALIERRKGEWKGLPKGRLVSVYCGLQDEDIFKIVYESKPGVLSIDAPLSLPSNTWREVDIKIREILRKIHPPLIKWMLPPIKLRQMKILTERGIHISETLEDKIEVIETHPRASFLFLFGENLKKTLILYKKKEKTLKRDALLELTLTLECLIAGILHRISDDDKLDATFSAYVSLLYKENPEKVLILSTGENTPPFVVPKPQTIEI